MANDMKAMSLRTVRTANINYPTTSRKGSKAMAATSTGEDGGGGGADKWGDPFKKGRETEGASER